LAAGALPRTPLGQLGPPLGSLQRSPYLVAGGERAYRPREAPPQESQKEGMVGKAGKRGSEKERRGGKKKREWRGRDGK